MKECVKCNQQINNNLNFCPNCGHNQIQTTLNQNSSVLIILGILTIVGSLFTIVRAYFYEIISLIDSDHDYYRGWIYAGTSLGTLVGAIIIMLKKKYGLYIYSISQIIYIITVIYATFIYNDNVNNDGFFKDTNELAIAIAMLFLVPSIIFLALYWSKYVRKHLV